MKPEVIAILKDIRAIFANIMNALSLLPSPIRSKVQPYVEANQLLLARIHQNLEKLEKSK
jgi:hypothetical protein